MRPALIALSLSALAGCASALHLSAPPPPRPETALATLPTAPELGAAAIIARAHAAAGGEAWVNPRTLHLTGEAVFYQADGAVERHERYEMWRVYPETKGDAHAADGMVRIQSWRDGETAILLAFDGERSYTANGPQPPSEADRQWSENFGFGVIRFALGEDYALTRLPDDLVDGRPVFVVDVIDPSGGHTQFAIAQDNFQVLRVGFSTPRGWHERIYSDFYTLPGSPWVQPGRIRLLYNGVKQNELFWRSFTLNEEMAVPLFQIQGPP
jgi:hypothetical protein